MKDAGTKLVILDSRPYDEYHRMNIPDGIDAPGAELAYRVHDLAPDPATLVVVNCAGRTRSIIGCQSLRNAGIPNRVVALKDGTMGWELAGYSCERGASRVAPAPTTEGLAKAREAAKRVASRFGVRSVTREQVQAWQNDPVRTLYLLDVRTREEFEELRIAVRAMRPAGSWSRRQTNTSGCATRASCWSIRRGVRSVMTASWLVQMGWNDVVVLEPEKSDVSFFGWPTETGARARSIAGFKPWATVDRPNDAT
jgi:rhodanese-related sulfurtransferase